MSHICACGHQDFEHYQRRGRCETDVHRPELGRSFGCFCPQFDPDQHLNQQQKGMWK